MRPGPLDRHSPSGVVEGGQTFFGQTDAGDVTVLTANAGAQYQRSSHDGWGVGVRTSTVWTSFEVILDGHFAADSRWDSITVEIPHAWDWFSPTVTERGPRPMLDENHFSKLECTTNDLSLALWRGIAGETSQAVHTQRGQAAYTFTRPGGIKIGDVERPMLAIENLHRVLFGAPMSSDMLTLRGVVGGDEHRSVRHVRGGRTVNPEIALPDPYVSTNDVDFSEFVPRWIALHLDSPTWPNVGSPADRQGWLHTETLESIAALEATAREHVPTPSSKDSQHAEIVALADDLRSDAKRRLLRLVAEDGPSLAQRLVATARALGLNSSRWLLGERVHDWANVVGHVRNSLAHGLGTKGELELEPEVLIAVLESTRVVQQLTLLRLAGLPPSVAGEPPEYLRDATGTDQVRHPNASLAEQMRNLQEFRSRWPQWATSATH